MSIDTHMQLRTPLSAAQVRAALVHDPELADLHLMDHGERDSLGSNQVSLVVKPWEEEDRHLIDGGFETATVRVKLIPKRGPTRFEAEHRALAAVLRLVPGDVCAAQQDSAGPDLLRLGGVVYINSDWIGPADLTDFGYVPERLVVGIPPGLVEVGP